MVRKLRFLFFLVTSKITANNDEGTPLRRCIVYTHHAHQHRTQVLSYKAGFQDLEATALGPLHCDVIDLAEIMVACVEGRLDEVEIRTKDDETEWEIL